jgi:hypothetical protein
MWEGINMRHFAENRESNGSRLSKFSVSIICAIAVALATPAAYAQRGGSGRSGGAGRFGRGGSNRSRPFGGAHPHVPVLRFQVPSPIIEGKPIASRIDGPRLRLQFRRGSYLGYGFWPLYGWVASSLPDCVSHSGWDCYENEYSDTETHEPVPPTPINIRLSSVLVIYLRDGSGYGVSDYWIADGMLHFVTTYDSEKSVVLADVDWQRTVDDNAARGVYFNLSYAPSKQRLTPTIAPTCPGPSIQKIGFGGSGPSRPTGGGEVGLLGAVVSAVGQGVKVTFVRAGSPAARAGINPGDVVLRIDCQEVHNGDDIESAIAANTSGTLWVNYLIKGAWLSEQQIKVR